MTWNNITDGQPGLALPAMQNWRHSGRFNTHFIPLDSDGNTITAGTLNMGTASAPWGNLYVATGGAIYVGGSQFSGGGGSAGISVIEQKSHLEKEDIDYPLSDEQSLNESFTNIATMTLSLGKDHSLSDTTIYLDRNINTISTMEDSSVWTPNTGSVATNAVAGQFVYGVGGVKHTVTGTISTQYIAQSFTSFSLTDRKAKVWLYPSYSDVNIDQWEITLESSTGNSSSWHIAPASITANTLNSIVLDLDNPDTSTGTFVRGLTNNILLGNTTNSNQAIEATWNYLRDVDDNELYLPLNIPAYDLSTQEFIIVTTATDANDEYTISASTTANLGMTNTVLTLRQLEYNNNQAEFLSGTSGDVTKESWDITRQVFGNTASGSLNITQRYYDESFQVATVTSNSVTVLECSTDTADLRFLSGTVIYLYKWEDVDGENKSTYNSVIDNHYLALTLTADATATASKVTLAHANTSNQNLGNESAEKWKALPKTAEIYYSCESVATETGLSQATDTSFIINNQTENISFHDFTGGTTSAGIVPDWSNVDDQPFVDGTVNAVKLPGAADLCQRSSELIKQSFDGYYEIITTFWGDGVTFNDRSFSFSFGTTTKTDTEVNNMSDAAGDLSNTIDGVLVTIAEDNRIYVTDGDGITQYVSQAKAIAPLSFATRFTVKIHIYNNRIKVKAWLTISNEPSSWDIDYTKSSNWTFSSNYYGILERTIGSDIQWFTDYYFNFIGNNFIQKATIASQSGSKLVTATKLLRPDAVNQNPVVYQRDASIS